MKELEKEIGTHFYDRIMKPLRGKQDIILLLLDTIKLIKGDSEYIKDVKGKIVIHVDKMSRIFYITDKKIFSYYFPFVLEEKEGGEYRIYDRVTDLDITDQVISLLISIFQSENGKLGESLGGVMDFIIDRASEFEYEDIDSIWRILFRLWHMEEGYIRYDDDPEHANKDLHPRYHLDVNYSGGSTYKIGLRKPLEIENMRKLLDTTKDCVYLQNQN